MEDLLGVGGNDGRIGIHQIAEIGKDALPLDDQLLLHQSHRLGIIITEEAGKGIAL